jgi:hypothetical protein
MREQVKEWLLEKLRYNLRMQWQVLHSSEKAVLPELEKAGLVKQVGCWVVYIGPGSPWREA